ncbi:MAG: monovalent cation/H+ antiporter subunit D family protein [Gammaproteobacteria bacterium]|nr:monovalent cation/H+ antiporter subunit D family protein [Gammaproteobacteria bacterium]
MTTEALLVTALLLPLAGGLCIILTGRQPNLREACTLVTSGLLCLAVITMLFRVLDGARPEYILVDMLPGLAIHFEVEPLGMLFATIAAVLWPINSVYSIGYMRGNKEKNQTRFYFFFAVAIFGAMGVAFAGNLVTLFLCYEVLTLSTFPLVAHKGNDAARDGGRVYLGILLATSIGLLLPAIVWTWNVAGTVTFTAGGILADRLAGPALTVLALMYLLGIGKAAVMPVHRWLPAAMVAPTPVSALLHAVAVVKAGVFSVVKVTVYILGIDHVAGAPGIHWLLWLAGFTVIVASLVALRQDNLKMRLAYSTVSQLSYVVLGTMLLAPISIVGAALHILAHAFGKITLFFAAGSIYTSSKKTEVSQLDGIARRMPWTMTAFAIGALSMIGVPPAAGFVSKWYLLTGAIEAEQLVAVGVIVVSTLLNAAYFVPIIYVAFFRRESSESMLTYGEAPWPVVAAVCATAAITVSLFLFPGLALELVHRIPT